MTIAELENELNRLRVPKILYSLMTGGLPNERYCIVKEKSWQVYYSERGMRTGLKEFESESDACKYLLDNLKQYSNL